MLKIEQIESRRQQVEATFAPVVTITEEAKRAAQTKIVTMKGYMTKLNEQLKQITLQTQCKMNEVVQIQQYFLKGFYHGEAIKKHYGFLRWALKNKNINEPEYSLTAWHINILSQSLNHVTNLDAAKSQHCDIVHQRNLTQQRKIDLSLDIDRQEELLISYGVPPTNVFN